MNSYDGFGEKITALIKIKLRDPFVFKDYPFGTVFDCLMWEQCSLLFRELERFEPIHQRGNIVLDIVKLGTATEKFDRYVQLEGDYYEILKDNPTNR
jgi:hypothetical protein